MSIALDLQQRSLSLDPEDPISWHRAWQARSRLFGEAALLALFRDHSAWRRSDSSLQRRATEVLASELGPDFELLSLEEYSCRGLSTTVPSFRHRPSGVQLMAVPGGSYKIGSNLLQDRDAFLDEQPQRPITISPFLIGRYPLKQSEWDQIGGRDRRRWFGPDLPIDSVSWNDIQKWLSRAGSSLRLPSESEWEYACRAGSEDRFYWGPRFDSSFCWYEGNSEGRSWPVQLHDSKSNAFGLVDTLGHVFEWCADDWSDSYSDLPADGSPRQRPARENLKVLRGGSWEDASHWMRCAIRLEDDPSHSFAFAGLRVAASWPQSAFKNLQL